ncbi:MAG TPA: NAD(P)-binding domain-containing protein, partial [Acetobacteraceae bacterium]|nr:NAD(P)-binding domain-containing protein [Acetobacteraceae bacterium]
MPVIRRWNRASAVLWSRQWNGSARFDRETIAMKVGVIGLGSMGMGAALNLHRKGHAVTGCEVREAARAEFEAAQGRTVSRADQLPADLEAVVVFVINAAQTEDVLFGPAGCLSRLN